MPLGLFFRLVCLWPCWSVVVVVFTFFLRTLGVLLRLLNCNSLLLNEKRAMHILKKKNFLLDIR
jgi:hypothetical protein